MSLIENEYHPFRVGYVVNKIMSRTWHYTQVDDFQVFSGVGTRISDAERCITRI